MMEARRLTLLLVSFLCFSSSVLSSKLALGDEAVFLYYAYKADYVVNGWQNAHLAPHATYDAQRLLTFGEFLESVIPASAQAKFRQGYKADKKNADRNLDTINPDEEHAASYLRQADYYLGGLNDNALFYDNPSPHPGQQVKHSVRMKTVVDLIQKARQNVPSEESQELERILDSTVHSLNEVMEKRVVDNAAGELNELEKSGIEGLNIRTKPSPADSTVQILDTEETIKQSKFPTTVDEGMFRVWLVNLPDKNTVGDHTRLISALDTQFARIADPEPDC